MGRFCRKKSPLMKACSISPQKAFGIEEKAKTYAQKVQQAEALLAYAVQTNPKAFAKKCKEAGFGSSEVSHRDFIRTRFSLN